MSAIALSIDSSERASIKSLSGKVHDNSTLMPLPLIKATLLEIPKPIHPPFPIDCTMHRRCTDHTAKDGIIRMTDARPPPPK